MTVTTGEILRIVATIIWLDGNLNQNVFNAVVTGAGGPWDDEDIVSDAITWVLAMFGNLTGSISDECDGSQVQVYTYDTVGEDWDEVGTTPWTFNPTNANDQLPRGVAALINAKTGDPDVQGKKYLGGLTEEAVDDGLINAGTIAVIGDFGDDWVTPFVGGTSGADWDPGVWSPTTIALYGLTGTIITPTIPAYQRRRKRGVGS